MKRLILELSLKPFRDLGDEPIRAVCRDILRQWQLLIGDATEISFLLWAADGSEILDYRGRREEPFEWAKWIGIANGPWDDQHPCLHSQRWPYCDRPPVFTYERLAFVVQALREETVRLTGKPVKVGATFDPGPEFAESSFKYERHPEISVGNTMGKRRWVTCAATLHADRITYAGFPQGIPEGTTMGTFLGRQSQHFLTDLGFDYIWFSNGFAFALAAWNVTGEVFDGQAFDVSTAARVRDAVLRFWQDFRRECAHFPIETRGSNLSTGMDLSAHASPVREIYRGGFNLTAPVNSPWAALNGDYGLELVGWLSHIAALPENGLVPFRFYLHDPWWANSPWLDRYGREPYDIYLPLALSRLGSDGAVTRPHSVAFLTIDDSRGARPDQVPSEVTPHIQQALRDFPDEPGLVTWIYPFDEYHEWTFGAANRVDEVFFGDWFMRSAVNQGFPLSTVVTTSNFLAARETRPELFNRTILVSPAPDSGSPLAAALINHVVSGGQVLLYGPLRRADASLLSLLGVRCGQPISGTLDIRTSISGDRLGRGTAPTKLHLRALTSGGGAEEITIGEQLGDELLAQVSDGTNSRAFALVRSIGKNGGKLGWVRGALSATISADEMLPISDDPREWFQTEGLLRSILAKFGVSIQLHKPACETPAPVIVAARSRNGLFFSGFTPSTQVQLRWRLPDGVPVPVECEVLMDGTGEGTFTLAKAWHRECRVFVQQTQAGEVTCREKYAGAVDVSRRLILTGLVDATVIFLHDTSKPGRVRFQEEPPYLGLGRELPTETLSGSRTIARGLTGTVLISW